MQQEKGHSIHRQLTRMNLTLVIATAVLAFVGTMLITVRIEYHSIDSNLTNLAQIIAQLPQARRVLSGEAESEWLTDYLDGAVETIENVDVILVGDQAGTLVYSQDHRQIGAVYSGTAWKETLQGTTYVAGAEGLSQAERCAFAPVTDEAGNVIGFVAAGIYTRNIRMLVWSTLLQFLLIAAAACLFAMLLSSRVSRRIKQSLLGYEPEDFSRLFRRQEVVLESLEEGIIAIDHSARIIYINQAAAQLYGIRDREAALGRPIQDYSRATRLERLLRTGKPERNVSIDFLPGGRVLADRLPIRQDGKVVGAVAIFRDRTEVTQLAEDLTGVRHMVEAMRAYTHEFMNKLHVIHGLLQMEQYDMAQDYIMEITRTQQQAVSRVMDRIKDPTVAALLVGKTSRAAELGIRLILGADSQLSAAGRSLPSAALVSVLGNLIANAIDSLNQSGRQPKEITVSIQETEKGLFLCVEDTGLGIDPAVRPHIFEKGFSTKGEDRGTGLSLVKEVVDTYHGQIRVESERAVGAVFYVSFYQPLEGEERT